MARLIGCISSRKSLGSTETGKKAMSVLTHVFALVIIQHQDCRVLSWINRHFRETSIWKRTACLDRGDVAIVGVVAVQRFSSSSELSISAAFTMMNLVNNRPIDCQPIEPFKKIAPAQALTNEDGETAASLKPVPKSRRFRCLWQWPSSG